MTTRPLLASTAAATALLLGAAAGSPALASTAAAPAKGSAGSALSLLQVTAGGHQLALGDLTMTSDTVSGTPLASITLTPVTADGTAYGQQVITPSNSPVTVPAVSTPSALVSFASLTSPSFVTTATTAPATHLGSTSLGSLSLLGIAVPLTGSVDVGSSVSSTTGALGAKTVVLKNLALPSIADLLGGLGLDLSKLPVGTLDSLVGNLDLVTSAITTAEGAASGALAQVTAATSTVTAATAALSSANAGLAAPQSGVTSATATLQGLLDQIPLATLLTLPGANTIAGFTALPPLSQSLIDSLVPGTASAFSALTAAQTVLTTAQGVVATATATLATVTAALTALTAGLQSVLAPLQSLLTGVLNSTPLVSLGSLSLTSKAAATSNRSGGQQADVLGGSITGLKVLGTDVLDSVLGSSTLNLTDLVGSTATQLTSAIDGLTGTLSSVLSTVPGLPTLSIPAPKVELLTKTATTSISGGFGRAATTVQGLKITLPAIALPTSLALPGAASLPALSGVTQTVAGLLSSAPVSLNLLSLSDQAAFRPAVLASTPIAPITPITPTTPSTPSTPTAGLPNTGLPVGVVVLSLALIGGALVLRRRASAQT